MAAVDCFRSSPLCFRRLLLLFCFFVGVFHSNVAFAEEDNAEEKSESSQAAPTKKLQKPKKISIDSSRTVQGVFYGYVSFIHPKGISMVVIPQYQEYSRRTFMLDNETIYRVDKTKFSKNPLVPGDKVAVRYWGEPPLYLADTVFAVSGDFEPAKYIKRPKAKKTEGGAAAKKGKSGGH